MLGVQDGAGSQEEDTDASASVTPLGLSLNTVVPSSLPGFKTADLYRSGLCCQVQDRGRKGVGGTLDPFTVRAVMLAGGRHNGGGPGDVSPIGSFWAPHQRSAGALRTLFWIFNREAAVRGRVRLHEPPVRCFLEYQRSDVTESLTLFTYLCNCFT